MFLSQNNFYIIHKKSFFIHFKKTSYKYKILLVDNYTMARLPSSVWLITDRKWTNRNELLAYSI